MFITKEQLMIALDNSAIDSGDFITRIAFDKNAITVEGLSPDENGNLVNFRAVLPKASKKDDDIIEI